jgi:uncharacterized membrane protein
MANMDGSKTLFNDSKIGLLVNSLVTFAALALVEMLGSIDFSTWPTFLATAGAVLAGLVSNAVAAWAAKRRPAVPGAAGAGLS